MQHKFWAASADFPDFLVEILFLPGFEHEGLAFGEIAAHGKGRVRQVKRFFIVGHEMWKIALISSVCAETSFQGRQTRETKAA